jgi:hypothetical protein
VQADSSFWSKKNKKKVPAIKPRAAKAAPAPKKNKPALESETVNKGGSAAADDESEVKPDSLSIFLLNRLTPLFPRTLLTQAGLTTLR